VEVLLFAVGPQRCALPLTDVAEVMRAQPLTSHGLLTPGVLGTAIIRSQPTPVVDAGKLLTGESTSGERIILLRVGGRAVALAVDSVLGTARLEHRQLTDAPALVSGNSAIVKAIGVLDSELIHILNTVRLIRDSDAATATSESHRENGSVGV
jgi:chemotaxis signal transduction protein